MTSADMSSASEAGGQETALVRLGEFLRSRRSQVTPDRSNVEPRRRRRTEGLRREEVAARAGISADWYARIEVGSGAVPSVPTLHAIARALELNPLDTRYAFELAGLPVPNVELHPETESLAALEHALLDLPNTAAMMTDLYGSPLCWNAVADGLFRWSTYPDAFSRNGIVAGLTNPYYQTFFGDDFEPVARRMIGLFRRAYTIAAPTPLARRIYEFGMAQPLFEKLWNENSVSDDLSPPGPIVRTVVGIGELRLDVNDVVPVRRNNLIVRVLAPRDAESRARFALLAKIGRASDGLVLNQE